MITKRSKQILTHDDVVFCCLEHSAESCFSPLAHDQRIKGLSDQMIPSDACLDRRRLVLELYKHNKYMFEFLWADRITLIITNSHIELPDWHTETTGS
jgi:hypothetical protein